jgi:hypothetical protein
MTGRSPSYLKRAARIPQAAGPVLSPPRSVLRRPEVSDVVDVAGPPVSRGPGQRIPSPATWSWHSQATPPGLQHAALPAVPTSRDLPTISAQPKLPAIPAPGDLPPIPAPSGLPALRDLPVPVAKRRDLPTRAQEVADPPQPAVGNQAPQPALLAAPGPALVPSAVVADDARPVEVVALPGPPVSRAGAPAPAVGGRPGIPERQAGPVPKSVRPLPRSRTPVPQAGRAAASARRASLAIPSKSAELSPVPPRPMEVAADFGLHSREAPGANGTTSRATLLRSEPVQPPQPRHSPQPPDRAPVRIGTIEVVVAPPAPPPALPSVPLPAGAPAAAHPAGAGAGRLSRAMPSGFGLRQG